MSKTAPKNWNIVRLGNMIECSLAGEWGDPELKDDNDIPVLRSTNFTNSGIIDYSSLVVRNISEKKRNQKILKRGDILLEKSGGSPTQPVGRVVYFNNDRAFLYSNFTQKLTPSVNVDSKYIFYKMYFEYQNGLVLRYQQQTTGIINFQLSEYLNLKVKVPPKEEQQKIAAILTTVDDVIESTQAQINKLKDLKTGMMQELLTKGIGHTEFKDSPVGRIPKSWGVSPLGEHVTLIPGYAFSSDQFVESGVPLIRMGNLYQNQLDLKRASIFLPNEFLEKYKKFVISPGDIVFSMTGTAGKEDYGYAVSVPLNTPLCLLNQRVAKIIGGVGIDQRFLHNFLQSRIFLNEIYSIGKGTKQANLSSTNILSVNLPIPPIQEQIYIAKLLDSISERVERIAEKLGRSFDLKKALMQDLLTGNVRVKVSQ